jgi:hypothetical protein
MSEDPIRRGARWKLFLEEEGGLNDMLAVILLGGEHTELVPVLGDLEARFV